MLHAPYLNCRDEYAGKSLDSACQRRLPPPEPLSHGDGRGASAGSPGGPRTRRRRRNCRECEGAHTIAAQTAEGSSLGVHDDLVREQIAYYRARAPEYDQWFLRQGRYDRGEEVNGRWFAEVAEVAAALDDFRPTGDVLELACGTGLWTQRLARHAASITAVDASTEMLALNRGRLGGAAVRYVQADLFSWQPDRRYDVVFFSFWLSHVPPERFAGFWGLVTASLAPGGRFFFVDSLYEPTSIARDHALEGPEATSVRRRLNDGSEYRIVKVFYVPAELQERLSALGIQATVRSTANFFLYGWGCTG